MQKDERARTVETSPRRRIRGFAVAPLIALAASTFAGPARAQNMIAKFIRIDPEPTTDEKKGTPVIPMLVELGTLTESQLVSALAGQVGMQFVDLDTYPVDRIAVSRLQGAVCRRYTVLPIAFENGAILLAMADPGNVLAVDDMAVNR